ncbi:MAG: IS21 family transposase, partial [Candidatus Marinimicrobia bacterium]|nr:IS21 family transposase [Candidatus Neomarinimicrobiota bacterium]
RRFNNNESIRNIARVTKLHRETVKKYISEHEKGLVELYKRKDNATEKDICKIIETPKYKQRITPKRKVTSEIMVRIKELLKINEENRKIGLYKQQLKMIDIYEDLKLQGYDIGYTTVCGLIKELSAKPKEAFIRQAYELGEDCEFDWGEVTLKINGELKKYQLAVFTSCAGNYRYSRLFEKQDTASFQEAHAWFFKKIGGVYKRMIYDNMKVVVKKFVGHNIKEPTKGLLQLSMYYHFTFRFCNVRKGNEKGHVERSVEVVRRKILTKKTDFESTASANEYLEKENDKLNDKVPVGAKQSPSEILESEQKYLFPLLPFFSASKIEQLKVDKYSTISFETNRYSIPDHYVGKCMTVRIYPTKLKISYNDENLCEHERLSGSYDWQLNINHYLRTLERKPGALSGSLALKQMKTGKCDDKTLREIYDKYYRQAGKEFVKLLQYIKEKESDCPRHVKIKEIDNIIKGLGFIKSGEILTDKIITICEKNEDKQQKSDGIVKYGIDKIIIASKNILEEAAKFMGYFNNGGEKETSV